MAVSSTIPPEIMVVEDNPLISEFVAAHLQHEGFEVTVAEGCVEAMTLLTQRRPKLLVLDVVLDDGLGFDLCRMIRAGGADGELIQHMDIPILMLTARADEQDRVQGFEAGADDYLTKPFSPAELVYRIQAILRRSEGTSSAVLSFGPLTIDPRTRVATIRGESLDLSPKEFDLLFLLTHNSERVFSREDLLERVWGYSYLGNTRTVDVHINRLRQKLAVDAECAEMIFTEWGVGYKFSFPMERTASA